MRFAGIEALESRQLLSIAPALASAPVAPPTAAVLAVDQTAPNFAAAYYDGSGTYIMSQDTNRVIVLNFFSTQFSLAIQTVPQIVAVYNHEKQQQAPVTVRIIDEQDAMNVLANYLRTQPDAAPIMLMDPNGTVGSLYDVAACPVTYVIANNAIKFVHPSYSNTLEQDLEYEIQQLLDQPQVSAMGTTVTEGTGTDVTARFWVELSQPSSNVVSVNFETTPGTASLVTDYHSVSGTLVFQPGETKKYVDVTVYGDSLIEDDESFGLTLSRPMQSTIAVANVGCTIYDDDHPVLPPTLTIGDARVVEGDAGQKVAQLTVTLTNPPAADLVSFNGEVSVLSTATDGVDYMINSPLGPLTLSAANPTYTIEVLINGDTLDETDESVIINLNTPSTGLQIDKDTGTVQIIDDDPYLSVDNISTVEGNVGTHDVTFTISLTAPTDQTVSVEYWTHNGTATAGQDFLGVRGTAVFAPGATTYQVPVTIIGDGIQEGDEVFTLELGNASGAAVGKVAGTGKILADGDVASALPEIFVGIPTIMETVDGTTLDFPVMLSAAVGTEVAFSYATANGTATATKDYLARSGRIRFPAGSDSATISVPVLDDLVSEPDETVLLNLYGVAGATLASSQVTGTIIDNDPLVQLSLGNAKVVEGNKSQRILVFPASLNTASGQTVTVNYQTADGTAAGGEDYDVTSGTLTFVPGELFHEVRIPINGDLTPEDNEQFYVNLTNPQAVTLVSDHATGTISDDDRAPKIKLVCNTVKQSLVEGQRTPPVNFGVVYRGSAPVLRKFTLVNTGDATLRLGALSIPPGFDIVNNLVKQLAPGQSDVFVLRMRTDTLGYKSGFVRFNTNASVRNRYDFSVTGRVVPPGTRLSAYTRAARSAPALAPARPDLAGKFAASNSLAWLAKAGDVL